MWIIMIAIAAVMLIVMVNLKSGQKVQDGPFDIRAISDSNDEVSIILEKVRFNLSGNVDIPTGVKTIGYEVFKGMNDIESVNIHGKVKIIGVRAFDGCSMIREIYTGESTESICDEAFQGCTSLEIVKIGPRAKKIGLKSFASCPNIKSITLDGYDIPEAFSDTFDDSIKANCALNIHKDCSEKLRKTPGWDKFCNIIEIDN